jgi:hypothetical protein
MNEEVGSQPRSVAKGFANDERPMTNDENFKEHHG